MAKPTYEQVWQFARSVMHVRTSAANRFKELAKKVDLTDPNAREYLIRALNALVAYYGPAARELGAEWFEFCSPDNVRVTSVIGTTDIRSVGVRANNIFEQFVKAQITEAQLKDLLAGLTSEAVQKEARDSILENISDYNRENNLAGSRNEVGFCRVPVGETCAWCIMLASNGYWYRTADSAIWQNGIPGGDKFHRHCDCVAVPFNRADSIEGYDYGRYQEMYYTANGQRQNVRAGRARYSPELAQRISDAKAHHEAEYAAGKTRTKWTVYNETLIVMRDMYGLQH